jgi:hypothetical protein
MLTSVFSNGNAAATPTSGTVLRLCSLNFSDDAMQCNEMKLRGWLAGFFYFDDALALD